jgi:hypothetical protein
VIRKQREFAKFLFRFSSETDWGDGVRKAIQDRQVALANLVHAIQEYRKLAESTPLTLQGSEYAHAVLELNKAIDRAEALCSNDFPSDAMRNPSSPQSQS